MKGYLTGLALLCTVSPLFAQMDCHIQIYNRSQTPVKFITGDARIIGESNPNHRWIETHHLCLDEKTIMAITAQGHAVSLLHYHVTSDEEEALLTYPDSFHIL
jgi:hypothetical protein